jgi:hypothetical protein
MREAVMVGEALIFLPSPLVGEGGAERSSATGEGFLRLGELCENVLQYGSGLLQHVIVPVAHDPETFGDQDSFPRHVAPRRCMLTAIDLDDDPLFEANEVQNEALKRDRRRNLKSASRRPRSSRRMAASASVGSRRIFFAKVRMRLAVGRWFGVCGTNPSPGAFGATLSHKGRGED